MLQVHTCFNFLLVFTFASRAYAFLSLLTDVENKTSTTLETKEHTWNDVDFLRQMINQETVIRLALVKNVQALVSDVNLMKKSITTNELTISALQQSIETLNVRVDSLERENKRLKDSSVDRQDRILDLEARLQTVNASVNSLNENLYTSQKESDKKRQEIVNKTNGVVNDIKMEVRYLSVTLFDFKEHTTTLDNNRKTEYNELEAAFNTSVEKLQAENHETKREFMKITALINNLDEARKEFQTSMTANLTTAITELETQTRKSEYERLKLSSAVSSLETFKLNMTKSNCEKNIRSAFSAGISSGNGGWSGSTLIFPVVIYSEGKGYDPNTGVFTASSEGTYLFYVTIQSALQNLNYFDIVLNGSAKVRTLAWYDSGNAIRIYQTGTNLVILYLTTGDRVWVQRAGGTGYYSDSAHISTFSGIRLY